MLSVQTKHQLALKEWIPLHRAVFAWAFNDDSKKSTANKKPIFELTDDEIAEIARKPPSKTRIRRAPQGENRGRASFDRYSYRYISVLFPNQLRGNGSRRPARRQNRSGHRSKSRASAQQLSQMSQMVI
jgi:hypothetical protein